MSSAVRRLTKGFTPQHYKLSLSIDKAAMTFSGSVTIRGRKGQRPSQRITFHQKGLTVTKATVVRHDKRGDQHFDVTRINTHAAYNELRLHTEEVLFPGEYTVTCEFSGVITRPMNGMYPCFFKDKGKDKLLIATQFESHYAREVFPCIDEPEAKATFDLTLETRAGETVLSNTPVKTQKISGKKVTTTFETTPLMSTYLLAFVAGDIGYKESKTKAGTVVRTYATPENVDHTAFALDVAVKCLDFYEDYFGIPYPLAKCDMIALPDFASGAMENWGLITYREQTLLVDPKNTSLTMKQYVAMVVAHELAHQWFGNLVTMHWWTDLWLNEGFASWIEYLAVDKLFPDWQMWTQFLVDEQQSAMKLDALEHTHPIEVPVHHPDEIHAIFDAISYNKGASVINMLHNYLGPKAFRDGLRHYLQIHAYGNTATVDLWDALEKISNKPVKTFMHAWTSQPGFPIVKAEVGSDSLTVHQHRFYSNPTAKKVKTHWPVPLLGSHGLQEESFSGTEASFDIGKDGVPLHLNQGHSGFYRTVYNKKHLATLAAAVKSGELPAIERLGVLSDSLEAAKAGHAPVLETIELMASYEHEDNAAVWDIMAAVISDIRRVMDDEPLRDAMKPYVRDLVTEQFGRLGWTERKDDSYFDKLLRPVILGLASLSEEPSVLKECARQFDAMKAPEDLDPDVRGVIYGTAARTGGKKEFDKMMKMHNASSSSEERVTLSAALTNFSRPELIDRALATIDTSDVRLQDASYWLAYSYMNRHAKQATWQWMTTHWQWILDNFSNDLSFYQLPLYSARAFSDAGFLPAYQSFFESVKQPALKRSISQGIEIIEWQSAWRKRDLADLKKHFKS